MAEILEDLRKRADSAREAQHHYGHNPVMTDADVVALCEAADTIEALQQRCEELEADLHKHREHFKLMRRDRDDHKERIAALEAALKDVYRFGLVIESAVRHADPGNHEAILALVKRIQALTSSESD